MKVVLYDSVRLRLMFVTFILLIVHETSVTLNPECVLDAPAFAEAELRGALLRGLNNFVGCAHSLIVVLLENAFVLFLTYNGVQSPTFSFCMHADSYLLFPSGKL